MSHFRSFVISCVILLNLFLVYSHSRANGWEVIKIGQRDYLNTAQIAEFYQLAKHASVGNSGQSFFWGNNSLKISLNSREAIINGVKHWLCLPVSQYQGKWLISRMDLVKTIDPIFRPNRITTAKNFDTIIIDPGHGGDDRGARSYYSPDEKLLTLDTAKRLGQLLKTSGFRVVLTRNSDVFVPLEERAQIANRYPNSIFVSLHFNSGGSHAKGIETFCLSPRGTQSVMSSRLKYSDFRELSGNDWDGNNILLAASVQGKLTELLSSNTEERGVKRARFSVLRECERPAILVEGGFVTHSQEGRKLATPIYRQQLAEKVKQGILDYSSLLNRGTKYRSVLLTQNQYSQEKEE